jgi:hypothetical protein
VFSGDTGGLMSKRVASLRVPNGRPGSGKDKYTESKISYSYLSNPLNAAANAGSPKSSTNEKAADVLMKETYMDNPGFSMRIKTVYSNPSSPHTSITFTDKQNNNNSKRVTSAEFDAEYLAYDRQEHEEGVSVPRELSIDMTNPAVGRIKSVPSVRLAD